MKKKTILVAAIAVMLVAALVVGGTLAYFTDTKTADNTFTMGNVAITLDEKNANPNAPTGRGVTLEFLEDLLQHNQDCVVIIDEAYVDFGAQSAVPLLGKYENLLIVQTTSKSRSLAGMRIGYALGSETLISTLEAVKNSYNSYTMDAIALAVGEASIRDEDYFQQTCRKVSTTRDRSAEALRALGFTVLPSLTNFLFVTHPNKKAPDIFAALREKGIFIRYFKLPRIDNYLRITVGTDAQMDKLIAALKEIL